MSIVEFLINVLGMPSSGQLSFLYYIIAALILMLLIDGIFTFIIAGISALTVRGKK